MGPEAFLGQLDASGLRPCDRTHLKSGLLPHLYAGGAYDKYSSYVLFVHDRRFGHTATVRLEAVWPLVQPGHFRVGKLHHWHLCHPCIALDKFEYTIIVYNLSRSLADPLLLK